MPLNFNKFIFRGTLTKDPEVVTTKSGKAMVKFSIAVQEEKNKANFFNLTAWDKTAEFLSKFAKQGCQVLAEGSISNSTTGEGDSKKHYTNFNCHHVEMIVWPKDKPEQVTDDAPAEFYGSNPGF